MSAPSHPRDRPSRSRSSRRARWSRSKRSRSPTDLRLELSGTFGRIEGCLGVHNGHVVKAIETYVHSLGIDAYLVGGAVRDELLGLESKDADFLVPAVGIAE